MKDKVRATPEALALLAEIVAEHGPVMFHQSGGCCDGSSPMCYPVDGFKIGENDVKLGEIGRLDAEHRLDPGEVERLEGGRIGWLEVPDPDHDRTRMLSNERLFNDEFGRRGVRAFGQPRIQHKLLQLERHRH